MKKVSKSKGKTTKSATTFRRNKPNSPIVQINLSYLTTMSYAISTSLTKVKNKPNQTQFKPNLRKAKNEHKFYNNNELQNFSPLTGHRNKPNSNPIASKVLSFTFAYRPGNVPGRDFSATVISAEICEIRRTRTKYSGASPMLHLLTWLAEVGRIIERIW